ncbi:MAG: hypothetical protein O3A00_24650, partial [Planctomycetota bacterium]|nr:hypothetical protein [Planctomycetota bacterium]
VLQQSRPSHPETEEPKIHWLLIVWSDRILLMLPLLMVAHSFADAVAEVVRSRSEIYLQEFMTRTLE